VCSITWTPIDLSLKTNERFPKSPDDDDMDAVGKCLWRFVEKARWGMHTNVLWLHVCPVDQVRWAIDSDQFGP